MMLLLWKSLLVSEITFALLRVTNNARRCSAIVRDEANIKILYKIYVIHIYTYIYITVYIYVVLYIHAA